MSGLANAIASKAIGFVVEHGKSVVIAGAAAAVGGAAVHVVDNIKFDKILQKEKKISFKYGVEKGVALGEEDIQRIYLYPALAGISMAYYMARSDGSISREEKWILDSKTDDLIKNPEIPPVVVKEVKKIIKNQDISFKDVREYLDELSFENVKRIYSSIIQIAEANGTVTTQEKRILGEYEDYLTEQYNIVEQRNYSKFNNTIVSKAKVKKTIDEYNRKMDQLDLEFSDKTKLDKTDIAFLITATLLQCLRIYLVNHLTSIEKAGKGVKEEYLHDFQKETLSPFGKEKNEVPRKYYAPIDQIVSTSGVPYDATKMATPDLNIFHGPKRGEGVNHRFATLGHDPWIGLVIGTTNIMTNTITTLNGVDIIPNTYHVQYTSDYKDPVILNVRGSLALAIKKVIDRSQEDIRPLTAALLKQVIHIATDMYTPAGLSLPGAGLVFSRKNVELLTQYVSYGDMVKFSASAGVNILINKVIELLHGMLLLEKGEDLEKDIHKVKTKKIILYSNSIATGNNIIQSVITSQYDKIDWAGLVVLINNIFKDIDFIYEVKREFLHKGLGETV